MNETKGDTWAATAAVARRVASWTGQQGVEARIAIRVTVAGLLAFAIGQWLGLAQGYWAVFTAIVVMQASVGNSFGAARDYFIGTLAGAVYGVAIAFAIPIGNAYELGLALVAALLPLAFLAAVRPNFRVAPVTAVIVLIIPAIQHSGVFDSAIGRVEEIAVGAGVGVVVSRFVFPARALNVAAGMMADTLAFAAGLMPALFGGFGEARDLAGLRQLQQGYRRSLVELDRVVAVAARERAGRLTTETDIAPLLRGLRRLRLDFAVIGRAGSAVLPDRVRPALLPPITRVTAALGEHLGALAEATRGRRAPPSLDAVADAVTAYTVAMRDLRKADQTRDLPEREAARIFTVGYALDELRRNLGEINERVAELARAK
jgi:uncharacterized membrane protein YccC